MSTTTYIDPGKTPILDNTSQIKNAPVSSGTVSKRLVPAFYFGIPQNENILKMWDVVADRMYKIHNCRDIDGNIRQLPLFQPPIDPALLVKARAAGLSIASVLNDLYGDSLLPYKFRNVLSKALEFAGDVKSFGSTLLSAYEKKDSEKLAVLRQTVEVDMLKRITTLKEKAVDEAKENFEALKKNYKGVEHRRDFYNSRKFMSPDEELSNELRISGQALNLASGTIRLGAGVAAAIPQLSAGFPCNFVTTGGLNINAVLSSVADSVAVVGQGMQLGADITGTRASYKRRMDDWKFQGKGAEIELTAMDRQLIAAEIRLAVARADLNNHQKQIKEVQDVATVLTNKFTNEQLYDWMISQLSAVYFRSYDMAYTMAKKAEAAYNYELGLSDSIVSFGYWNSLNKGLLAGELLSTDLRKLEMQYMENNKRRFEITQHFNFEGSSLGDLMGSSGAVLNISSSNYQGLKNKRVKGVKITVPCVVGPYENVAAKLSVVADGIPVSSMVTSSGNNDSGTLTFNFDDERYLPFEGLNLENNPSWMFKFLELTNNPTVTKVIITVNYTATE